jgi:hypothetical protein
LARYRDRRLCCSPPHPPLASGFEYLSVLISIIGLGITHLLTSVARLIQPRGELRFLGALSEPSGTSPAESAREKHIP